MVTVGQEAIWGGLKTRVYCIGHGEITLVNEKNGDKYSMPHSVVDVFLNKGHGALWYVAYHSKHKQRNMVHRFFKLKPTR